MCEYSLAVEDLTVIQWREQLGSSGKYLLASSKGKFPRSQTRGEFYQGDRGSEDFHRLHMSERGREADVKINNK
jgi:hypothetical protein